jgi:hypothetical protein
LNCEPKSPLTKRSIELIALILRSFSLTNDSNLSQTFTEEHNKSDEENQPPIGSQELDISLNDEFSRVTQKWIFFDFKSFEKRIDYCFGQRRANSDGYYNYRTFYTLLIFSKYWNHL